MPAHWSWRIEVRPRRRTLGIEVRPDASIVVAVPENADPDAVANAVRSRLPWLATAIKRRKELVAEHPAKQLLDGEGFAYLGRHYRLLLVENQSVPVRLSGGWLRLRWPTTASCAASAIIDWYRTRGQRWLADHVRGWHSRIGVPLPTIEVRDLGTRWGLRERDNTIAIHWAVLQLPVELIELVLVHELVHLAARRHDKEFRRRLLLAMPDADLLERRLAEQGRLVWMGAIRTERGIVNP